MNNKTSEEAIEIMQQNCEHFKNVWKEDGQISAIDLFSLASNLKFEETYLKAIIEESKDIFKGFNLDFFQGKESTPGNVHGSARGMPRGPSEGAASTAVPVAPAAAREGK